MDLLDKRLLSGDNYADDNGEVSDCEILFDCYHNGQVTLTILKKCELMYVCKLCRTIFTNLYHYANHCANCGHRARSLAGTIRDQMLALKTSTAKVYDEEDTIPYDADDLNHFTPITIIKQEPQDYPIDIHYEGNSSTSKTAPKNAIIPACSIKKEPSDRDSEVSEPDLDIDCSEEEDESSNCPNEIGPDEPAKPANSNALKVLTITDELSRNTRAFFPPYYICLNKEDEEQMDAKEHLCLKCNQKFIKLSYMRRHFALKHLGYKRFKCKLCEYTCTYARECKYHVLENHPKHMNRKMFFLLKAILEDTKCRNRLIRLQQTTEEAIKKMVENDIQVSEDAEDEGETPKDDPEVEQMFFLPYRVIITKEEEGRMLNMKELLCLGCNHKFSSRTCLQKHLALFHLGYKRFKCKICEYTCNFRRECRKHLIDDHQKDGKNLTLFLELNALLESTKRKTRFKLNLNPSVPPTPTEGDASKDNNASANPDTNLNSADCNQIKIKEEPMSPEDTMDDESSVHSGDQSEGNYGFDHNFVLEPGEIPNASYFPELQKRKHYRVYIHDDEAEMMNIDELVCLKCNEKFKREVQLFTHVATVHLGNKRFKCKLCEFKCDTKQDCKMHMLDVHKINAHFNTFMVIRSLLASSRRNRLKADTMTVPCNDEEKSTRGSLTVIVKDESGVLSSEVDLASKSTKRIATVEQDEASNSRMSSNESSEGNAGAASGATMEDIKIFSLPYRVILNKDEQKMIDMKALICLKCNQKFSKQTCLRRHLAVFHLGYKRFKCKLCPFETNYEKACKDHIVKFHPKFSLDTFRTIFCQLNCLLPTTRRTNVLTSAIGS